MRLSNAVFACVLVIFVSGCEQSVEEVCQETSNILTEKQGQGFTDVGMLGCLQLGAREAKIQQEVVKSW